MIGLISIIIQLMFLFGLFNLTIEINKINLRDQEILMCLRKTIDLQKQNANSSISNLNYLGDIQLWIVGGTLILLGCAAGYYFYNHGLASELMLINIKNNQKISECNNKLLEEMLSKLVDNNTNLTLAQAELLNKNIEVLIKMISETSTVIVSGINANAYQITPAAVEIMENLGSLF